MQPFYLILFISTTACTLTFRGNAQSSLPADHIADTTYQTAINLYHAFLTPEQALYRGCEYIEYTPMLNEGQPYFNNWPLTPGDLVYNGMRYEHVLLQYDVVKDLLITNEPYNFFRIALYSNQVERFSIGEHHFIRLVGSAAPAGTGFYQQLYTGRLQLLKKEKRTIEEDIADGSVHRKLVPSTSYFLRKDNRFYPVNNKGTLLAALSDKRKQVRQYIRSGGIQMKSDKENSLLKIIAWYDSL